MNQLTSRRRWKDPARARDRGLERDVRRIGDPDVVPPDWRPWAGRSTAPSRSRDLPARIMPYDGARRGRREARPRWPPTPAITEAYVSFTTSAGRVTGLYMVVMSVRPRPAADLRRADVHGPGLRGG
ncbi:hypothetical protein HBB16_01795 [Pseudonocardia sp. MCCB 268]|nr:hypothetical protein [Pseudonocardia cytotoxica]